MTKHVFTFQAESQEMDEKTYGEEAHFLLEVFFDCFVYFLYNLPLYPALNSPALQKWQNSQTQIHHKNWIFLFLFCRMFFFVDNLSVSTFYCSVCFVLVRINLETSMHKFKLNEKIQEIREVHEN